MASPVFGLVYDLLGSYPRKPRDPAAVEFEPEETIEVLERAIRRLGHQPLRIGHPQGLLAQLGKSELPPLDLDVDLAIAEATRARDREVWAPVLFEIAGFPRLGPDAHAVARTGVAVITPP